MKVSELIEKLSDIKQEHGDMIVCVQHRDDGGVYYTFEVLNTDFSLYIDVKEDKECRETMLINHRTLKS